MEKGENKLFVGENLNELLEFLKNEKELSKYTIADFCEEYDLSYGTWVRTFRDESKLGAKLLAFLLEEFPELNFNWLFSGKGPMWQNNEYVSEKSKAKSETTTVQDLLKEIQEIKKHIDFPQ